SRRRGCSPCRYIYWRFRFLVASPTVRDLLLFAKHLFVAANGGSDCDVGPARAFLCSSRSPSRETPTTTMGSGTRTASPFSTLSSMRRSRSAKIKTKLLTFVPDNVPLFRIFGNKNLLARMLQDKER